MNSSKDYKKCTTFAYEFMTIIINHCALIRLKQVHLPPQKTLTDSQDKAFRRISELKEQSQLDHLAKQHIEDNYRLMLEEKDELVKVLQTQVCVMAQ